MKLRQKTTMMAITLALTLIFGASGCGPPTVQPSHYGWGPCNPYYVDSASPHLVRWTPNGTHILFGLEKVLYLVDSTGFSLRELTDANPLKDIRLDGSLMRHGLRADISPDGLRVVYTTCEYPTQEERRSKRSVRRYPDWRDDPNSYNYEIAISNIDGAGKRRLTENVHLDTYPTWSPDGSRIAFISYARSTPDRRVSGYTLYTMSPDGSNVRELTPTFPKADEPVDTDVSLWSPPKWSPDGERIAFLVSGPDETALYTVKADGSNLTRIAATRHDPSWSPDSQRLAFLAERGDGLALRTAAADGSDIREVGSWDDGFAWKNAISWSPSGHEFMLIPVDPGGGTIFVVGMDGSTIGQFRGDYAEWSPDGSRIAGFISQPSSFRDMAPPIHYRGALLTIAPDGSDIRVLAEATDGESSWVAARVGAMTVADRIAQCGTDTVGPDNPGLSKDCKTLLTVNGTFPEGATNWAAGKSIWEWRGVHVARQPPRVTRQPPRVTGLTLGEEIDSPLRPEIGRLSELIFLAVHGGQGPIPPEWGELSELSMLILDTETIMGGIPPELGKLNLRNLTVPGIEFLEMGECFPESLVAPLIIRGYPDPNLPYPETWRDFNTIEDLNSRFGTDLKPC